MMSRLGCVYGSTPDEGIIEDAYDLKMETSLVEDESTKSSTNISNDLHDSEMASYYNCVVSLSDDSGFNSDSESRDSVDESVLYTNCDFDPQVKKVKKLNIICLQQSDDALLHGPINLAMRLKSFAQPKTHLKPDLALLNNKLGTVDPDEISNRKNIFIKNQSQRHGTANSLATYDSAANIRTRKSRRTAQDLNSNVTGSKNLNSFLIKAPFKLQDCFQDQGVLSLVACIVYTLILMVIIGFLSMIMASLKSYIGTQNLKTMRKQIICHRRTRVHMTAG